LFGAVITAARRPGGLHKTAIFSNTNMLMKEKKDE
jgi:hypothetical protein